MCLFFVLQVLSQGRRRPPGRAEGPVRRAALQVGAPHEEPAPLSRLPQVVHGALREALVS